MYCNHFITDKLDEETEYGICLLDEEFEPYLEEILENRERSAYKDLIEKKNFECDKEACEKFEPAEIFYIDDNTPLARALKKFLKKRTEKT